MTTARVPRPAVVKPLITKRVLPVTTATSPSMLHGNPRPSLVPPPKAKKP